MKCPKCGSLNADEVNISINWSRCEPGEECVYTGWTEYGEPSEMIGVGCNDCCEETWSEDAKEICMRFLFGDSPT